MYRVEVYLKRTTFTQGIHKYNVSLTTIKSTRFLVKTPFFYGGTDAQKNNEIIALKDQIKKLKKEIKELKYADSGK